MEEIKKAVLISAIVSVLGGLVIFIGWDVAIDKYLIPRVEAKLLAEKYLRDDIKKGMFVSTNQEAFNSNHIIDANHLISLKDNKIAHLESLTVIEEQISQLKARLTELETTKISNMNQSINEVLAGLSILKAKDEGKIELKVYFHKDASQQGWLILNRNNPAVSSLIHNNDTYKITSFNNNNEKYKIRIQDLTLNGKLVNEAIASLYIKDHDELFDSSKSSGIGTAFIALN